MNKETNQSSFHPLVAIAGSCAGASAGIVAIAFALLHNISDNGMWAIAAMVAAPSVMGIGIAYFMSKQPQPASSPAAPELS